MPFMTEWIFPELFYSHAGVMVFRTYKDNDADSPLTFWFTTHAFEDADYEFDIRDLTGPLTDRGLLPSGFNGSDSEQLKQVLRIAIDAGLLKLADPSV